MWESDTISILGVGFDVGVRNLGMAIVERRIGVAGYERFKCIRLQLIDLNSKVTNEAVETLHEKLNNIWPLLDRCQYVNIEQQPESQHLGQKFAATTARRRDNTQMKSISHAIQAWFLSRMKTVEFISAKSKLEVYDGPPIVIPTKSVDKYYQRKKLSIAHTNEILKGDQEWLHYIGLLDKKDDVCDAFLQCCYALDRHAKQIEKTAVNKMVVL